MLHSITPLIITYNEATNIGRTLAKLSWSRRTVVIDSGSTDGTLDILRDYEHVEVFHHTFTDFAGQCNYGLTKVTSEWVLSLDADYELSDELVANMHSLVPSDKINGYRAHFVYKVYGRPLRGALYPPRTILYRREKARYLNEGHGHRVIVDGDLMEIKGVIYHDDRKPLLRWIASQKRYAHDERNYLLGTPPSALSKVDRIRLMAWPAPILVFLYTLLVKGCILDGWAGWYYVLQRSLAETLIALEIIDQRLRGKLARSQQDS